VLAARVAGRELVEEELDARVHGRSPRGMLSSDRCALALMSVLEPRPDPETVSALLDTGWRVAEAEAGRTDSLDRKTATLASFSSILVSIAAISAASVGDAELPARGQLAVVVGLIGAITLLTSAVVVSVIALLPQEHTGLGTGFVEGLPTWREVRKPPETVKGEALRGVVKMVNRERRINDRKTRLVRAALALLLSGVVLIALDGLTLIVWTTIL